MAEKIKYVFPSGLEVTGTFEELEAISKSLKVSLDYTKLGRIPRGYYPSESKGLTKIADMSPYWLRRALLKRGRDYFSEIYVASDSTTTFLKKFTSLTDDQVVVDLYNEIVKRG